MALFADAMEVRYLCHEFISIVGFLDCYCGWFVILDYFQKILLCWGHASSIPLEYVVHFDLCFFGSRLGRFCGECFGELDSRDRLCPLRLLDGLRLLLCFFFPLFRFWSSFSYRWMSSCDSVFVIWALFVCLSFISFVAVSSFWYSGLVHIAGVCVGLDILVDELARVSYVCILLFLVSWYL